MSVQGRVSLGGVYQGLFGTERAGERLEVRLEASELCRPLIDQPSRLAGLDVSLRVAVQDDACARHFDWHGRGRRTVWTSAGG